MKGTGIIISQCLGILLLTTKANQYDSLIQDQSVNFMKVRNELNEKEYNNSGTFDALEDKLTDLHYI